MTVSIVCKFLNMNGLFHHFHHCILGKVSTGKTFPPSYFCRLAHLLVLSGESPDIIQALLFGFFRLIRPHKVLILPARKLRASGTRLT